MELTTPNGTVIELYDSITEIPRIVHHRMRKFSIQAASLEVEIRSQVVEASHWLSRGKTEEAGTCMENILISLFALENDHSFQDQEWGSLVIRVNGEDFVWSETNVKKLIEDSGITTGLLTNSLDDIKKKLTDQLSVSFPKRHNSVAFLVEQNSLMIRYAKAQLRNIQEQTEDSAKALNEAFNDIMDARTPPVFNAKKSNSVLVEMDKAYGKMGVSLMGNGVNVPDQITVFELECAIEVLDKSNANSQSGKPTDMV